MSDLWIIVCVVCFLSLIECQTLSTIQNITDWFAAFQTCKRICGRLPGVNISNNQLKLQDLSVIKNISSPFWTGATYDFLDITVTEPPYGYQYPYTCCDEIRNFGGKHRVICSNCSTYNDVFCATSTSKISIGEKIYIPWKYAFLECQKRNLRLPTRDNAQFLEKVILQAGAFWLDGIKQINFKPDNEIQNRNCLYSEIGIIHEGNCSNNSVATVCIFDNNASGSEQTCICSVNTASPSKAGSLQTTDNKFLSWGIVAALSVLLTVSTIAIIVLVIKLRHVRRQMAQEWKEEATSTQQLADVNSYQALDRRNLDSRNEYDMLTHNT